MRKTRILEMPNAAPEQADVIIVPVPLERTVSFKPGTRYSPEQIIECCDHLEFFEDSIGWSPFEYLKICLTPAIAFDQEEPLKSSHDRITQTFAELPKGGLMIALGGEHSITPSIVAASMPEPGHVVFIDAHGDFREQYRGSIYNHACPVWRLHEAGHSITLIGVRSLYGPEYEAMQRTDRIHLYSDEMLARPGAWEDLGRHLSALSGPLYLSVDMDGFDPALVPGVGTPHPGGLSWRQGCFVVDRLLALQSVDLRGIDIVELAPDANRVSDMVAAKLMWRCISHWGASRGFRGGDRVGSQMSVEMD